MGEYSSISTPKMKVGCWLRSAVLDLDSEYCNRTTAKNACISRLKFILWDYSNIFNGVSIICTI